MFKAGGDQMLVSMPLLRWARLMTALSGRFFSGHGERDTREWSAGA
jgi:hypothetical protein